MFYGYHRFVLLQEFVYAGTAIGLARTQYCGWPLRLVRTIWIMLGFQAYCPPAGISCGVFAN